MRGARFFFVFFMRSSENEFLFAPWALWELRPEGRPHIHQSSSEDAFCMTVAFRICPSKWRTCSQHKVEVGMPSFHSVCHMLCFRPIVLSRRLAATESIAVQWVLMAPHPMGSPPLTMGSCALFAHFPPLKKAPPCLSHGSRWVAPPICGWGHPSAQPIKTPFAENFKNYCL